MLGILIGLALLVFLSYKGYSIIWVAPVSGLVVALYAILFDGMTEYSLLTVYTGAYMSSLAGFVKSWFPLFFLGAVFGKLMDFTGAARAVSKLLVQVLGSKRALLAVILSCAVLTYGGVSLFVVVFAIYPLAINLYREANLPRRLIPGAIALGAFTFTMTALPGSPQLNNIIAGGYFHTSAYAAPIMGVVCAFVMFGLGYLYLLWKQKKVVAAGEHFTEPEELVVEDNRELPSAVASIIPLVAVIVVLYILNKVIAWEVTPATIFALLAGIVALIICNLNKRDVFMKALNEGGNGSMGAILNTAAAVGFGGVVRVVPGFQRLTEILLGLKGSPLISEGIAVTLIAGATGSSSGGMGIALSALAEDYIAVAAAQGINIEAFHRVATVASGGLDSLPHCGAVITLLGICGMTHKDSYNDIGMVTCVIPLAALVVAWIMGSLGIV